MCGIITLKYVIILCGIFQASAFQILAQQRHSAFRVVAFYTAKNDRAHITYVHEANEWFETASQKHEFMYDSTSDWRNLNETFLSHYDIVVFLDTRPELPAQRDAFQHYMEEGGAWIGFHFAGFALNNSDFPQDWDWYHTTFLGSGEYKSNTWRPTSAVLRIEDRAHPIALGLPETFSSAPNEWYRWSNDIRTNPNIKIMLSIDPTSFPLGTGPKQHEIWTSGYYPVVWTNTNYNMLYINMGHNDIDYGSGTNQQLSFTFKNDAQNKLIVNALLWLGHAKNSHVMKRSLH